MRTFISAMLPAALLLSALFVACGSQLTATYRLTVSSDGNGQVTPSGFVTESGGSNIQITAAANAGYHFTGWSVVSGDATIANSTASSTTVSLTGSGNLVYGALYYAEVEAHFALGPTTPVVSSAAGGPSDVTISWSMQSGATYALYWAAGSTVSTTTGTEIAGVTSPEVVSGLTNGSQYAFILVASSSGKTAQSSVVVAKPHPVDYIYVTGPGASAVLGYRIKADGSPAAVPGAGAAVGSAPSGVAATPNGGYLYVANSGSSNVSGFSINPDGSLSSVSGSPFALNGGVQPAFVAAGSSNAYLYLSDPAVSVLTIGSAGALSELSTSPLAMTESTSGLAVTPGGSFLYVVEPAPTSQIAVYKNVAGVLTLVGTPIATSGSTPVTAAATPDGLYLYSADNGGNDISIFSVNTSTGALTSAGTETANVSGPSAIVASPNSSYLYVANNTANTIAEFDIGSGGALTPMTVPTVATGSGPASLAMTPAGTFLYAANANDNTVSAYSIDSSGRLIPLPGSPYSPGISVQSMAIAHVTQ